MNFSFSSIAAGLHKITAAAEMLGPFASIIGVDKVTAIIETGLDIAENVATRATEANVVLHSNEQTEIDNIIARLREENDKLATYIDNS